MVLGAFRSILGVFGVSIPSKIPSISEERVSFWTGRERPQRAPCMREARVLVCMLHYNRLVGNSDGANCGNVSYRSIGWASTSRNPLSELVASLLVTSLPSHPPAHTLTHHPTQPMMIPRSSLKYLYGFTIFASLAGGLVLLRALESLNGGGSSRAHLEQNMSPQDREIFEAQSRAIAEMRRSAKERTPLENLKAAGLATHEFMVPPSQRRMMEEEETWRSYSKKQKGGEGARER